MAIYKVHIQTEGNKTTYTTNATILASVTYCAEVDKYDVSTPTGNVLADTAEEADNAARMSIVSFMASAGASPKFVNE